MGFKLENAGMHKLRCVIACIAVFAAACESRAIRVVANPALSSAGRNPVPSPGSPELRPAIVLAMEAVSPSLSSPHAAALASMVSMALNSELDGEDQNSLCALIESLATKNSEKRGALIEALANALALSDKSRSIAYAALLGATGAEREVQVEKATKLAAGSKAIEESLFAMLADTAVEPAVLVSSMSLVGAQKEDNQGYYASSLQNILLATSVGNAEKQSLIESWTQRPTEPGTQAEILIAGQLTDAGHLDDFVAVKTGSILVQSGDATLAAALNGALVASRGDSTAVAKLASLTRVVASDTLLPTFRDLLLSSLNSGLSENPSQQAHRWISIESVVASPTFAPLSGLSGSEGALLSHTLVAIDPANRPLTFSCISACPSGFAVSSGGALTWIPGYSDAGTHSPVLQVSNGLRSTQIAASISIQNTNRGPVVGGVSLSGTAKVGNTLLCSVSAEDPDGDSLSHAIAWEKSSDNGATFSPIAGETQSTLIPSAAVAHQTLRCVATSSDGSIQSMPGVSNQIALQNSNPTLPSSLSFSPAALSADDTQVTCLAPGVSDPDGDSVTIGFSWRKNGILLVGENSSTLNISSLVHRDVIQCSASASDAFGGVSTAVKSISPGNRNPTAGASIATATIYTNSSIQCSGAASTDPDGDLLVLNYAWKKNGFVIPGQSEATLAPGQVHVGDSVVCEVTAQDGFEGSDHAVSAAKIVQNLGPSAHASISPSLPTLADMATCSVSGSVDPDGEALTSAYIWKRNGVTVPSAISSTLNLATFALGDEIVCEATVKDPHEASASASSAAVTIQNRNPHAVALLSSASPNLGDSLGCISSGSSDPDGQALTFSYAWKRNGAVISGQSAATLALASYSIGDTLSCEATASDGEGGLSSAVSNQAVIANRIPTVHAALSPLNQALDGAFACDTSGSVDPDGDSISFSYIWKRNGSTVPGATSSSLVLSSFAVDDSIACLATATDARGGVGTVESSPRTIQNRNPLASATLTPTSPTLATTLTCDSSASSDPDGELLTFSYVWKKGGVVLGGQTANTLALAPYAFGDSFVCELTASDSHGGSHSAVSAAVTIQNGSPVAAAVLTPPSPTKASTLTCATAGSSDPDGDALSFSYRWKQNGTIIAGQTASTLSLASYGVGDSLVCEVTATDGRGGSSTVDSLARVIANRNPTPVAALAPASPTLAGTLNCATAGSSDPDGDALTFSFAWKRNGVTVAGANSGSLPLSSYAVGDTLVCELTANDVHGGNGTVASSPEVIQNRNPSAAATLSPANPTLASLLTCDPSASSDPDGDALTYTYLWKKNGTVVGGQTSSSLNLAAFAVGDGFVCEVTAEDGRGGSNTVVSASEVVENRAPVAAASLSPINPTTASTLICGTSGSSDPDGDTLSFSYVWKRNGTVLAGQTASSLALAPYGVGDSLVCELTATDGRSGSTTVASGAQVIQNRIPTAVATLSPASPDLGSTVTCDASGSSDPDGDTLSYSYKWRRNGIIVSGQTAGNLNLASYAIGDTIVCELTADDGHGGGSVANSAQKVIQNRSPVAVAALSLSNPTLASTLTCETSGSADADGDALSFAFGWKVNGATISGQISSTLSLSSYAIGDAIACVVTANDGRGGMGSVTSNASTIQNRNPVAVVDLTPESPTLGSTLTCGSAGSTDPDGDALSYSYVWKKNGTVIGGQTASTLPLGAFAIDDSFVCELTASDGRGGSSAALSVGRAVVNRAPVLSVAFVPATPANDSPVTCSTTGSLDPDGDSVSYGFVWRKNGVILPGENTNSYTPTSYAQNDSLECQVTATDSRSASTIAHAGPFNFGNQIPTAVASIVNSPIYTSTTVICSSVGSSDADGDSLTTAYVWKKNGSPIPGQTLATLLGGQVSVGDTLVCETTVSDGKGGSAVATSAGQVVQNRSPTAAAVLAPTAPTLGSTLSCGSAGSADPDGDGLSFSYVWKRNGSTLAGQTASSLVLSSYAIGDSFVCELTANDGHSGTHTAASSAEVIQNRNPVAAAALTPASPTLASTLTCGTAGSSDPDGDTLTYAYAWKRNGNAVAGQTASTLALSSYAIGDSFVCELTASDGRGGSHSVSSSAQVVQNRNPIAVASLSPASPTLASTLTCGNSGSSDADGDPLVFDYVWKKNGTVVAGQTASSLALAGYAIGDSFQCELTASDGRGGVHVASSAAQVIQNRNPVALAGITPASPTLANTLTCGSAGSSDADGDTLVFSYVWRKNGGVVAGQTGSTLALAPYAIGDSFVCDLTANDGRGGSHTSSSSAQVVQNRNPVAVSGLSPSNPTLASTLTCGTAGSSDADGDSLSFSYAWKKNGTTVAGQTASTLTLASYAIGDSFVCELTATDGRGGSHTASSSAQVVQNRNPVAVVSLTPVSPTLASTLTCDSSGSSDPDGDVPSFSYVWKKNGATVAGQTTSSLVLASYAIGDSFECTLTASDGRGGSHTTTSGARVIENRNPVAVAALSPANPVLASTLSCSAAGSSDPDGDALAFTYVWKKNGAAVAGQTASTLALAAYAIGDSFVCELTANDGRGGSHLASSSAQVIQNTNPVAVAGLTPASPTLASTLTCSTAGSSDADGDALSFGYVWKKNGSPVAGQTSSTLSLASYAVGDSFVCELTAADGRGGSHVASSVARVIQNTSPVAVASLTPANPTLASTLTCGTAGSSDSDGDTLNFTYAWKKNGTTVSGQTASTIVLATYSIGDSFVCELTASDGRGGVHSASSTAEVIQNRSPVAAASLTPVNPTLASTLTCGTAGSSDPDGDSLSFSYAWKKNGATLGGQTGSTLAMASHAIGDSFVCELTVNDGRGGTNAISSAAQAIQNRNPVSVASLTPANPTLASTLTCGTAGSSDPDGDSLSFSYVWKKNTAVISGETASTLILASYAIGDSFVCELTSHDGRGGSHMNASSAQIIQNRAPVPSASLLPASPTLADTLACSAAGSSDADGDTLSYTYAWYRNSVLISGQTTSSLVLTTYAIGDSLVCNVTAQDGRGGSANVNSTARSIANRLPIAAATITTSPAYVTSTLNCSPSGSSDPDGDSLSYSYAWSKNSVTIAGETTSSLSPGNFSRGDSVSCTVFVTDSHLGLTSANSASEAVLNRLPVAVATLSPTNPLVSNTLTCVTTGSADPDGDSLSFTYGWKKNGVTIDGQTASTLAPGPFVSGDMMTCSVTANDGHGGTHTVNSAVEVVFNQLPLANAGVDQSVAAAALVTLNGTSSSDPESHALTYSWSQSSGPAVGLSSTTAASPTFTAPSQSTSSTLVFSLTVNDGAQNSAADTVTIQVAADPALIPPTVTSGALTQTALSSSGISVSWQAATDNLTAQASLQYRLFYSTSSSFDTVAQVEAGTAATGWVTNGLSGSLSGLTSNTAYSINVVVKDGDGNKTVYAKMQQTTDGADGELISSSTYSTVADETGGAFAVLNNGDIVIAGQKDNEPTMFKFDKDFNSLPFAQPNYGPANGGFSSTYAAFNALAVDYAKGLIYVTGLKDPTDTANGILAVFDFAGNRKCVSNPGFPLTSVKMSEGLPFVAGYKVKTLYAVGFAAPANIVVDGSGNVTSCTVGTRQEWAVYTGMTNKNLAAAFGVFNGSTTPKYFLVGMGGSSNPTGKGIMTYYSGSAWNPAPFATTGSAGGLFLGGYYDGCQLVEEDTVRSQFFTLCTTGRTNTLPSNITFNLRAVTPATGNFVTNWSTAFSAGDLDDLAMASGSLLIMQRAGIAADTSQSGETSVYVGHAKKNTDLDHVIKKYTENHGTGVVTEDTTHWNKTIDLAVTQRSIKFAVDRVRNRLVVFGIVDDLNGSSYRDFYFKNYGVSGSRQLPGAFTIVSPSGGQPSAGTISFNASKYATAYTLTIATDAGCTNSVFSGSSSDMISKVSYTGLSAGSYYVCGRAVNENGSTSATNSGAVSLTIN